MVASPSSFWSFPKASSCAADELFSKSSLSFRITSSACSASASFLCASSRSTPSWNCPEISSCATDNSCSKWSHFGFNSWLISRSNSSHFGFNSSLISRSNASHFSLIASFSSFARSNSARKESVDCAFACRNSSTSVSKLMRVLTSFSNSRSNIFAFSSLVCAAVVNSSFNAFVCSRNATISSFKPSSPRVAFAAVSSNSCFKSSNSSRFARNSDLTVSVSFSASSTFRVISSIFAFVSVNSIFNRSSSFKLLALFSS